MNIKKAKKLLKDPKKFILDSKLAKKLHQKKLANESEIKLAFIIIGSDKSLSDKTSQSIIESEKEYFNKKHTQIFLYDEQIDFDSQDKTFASIINRIDSLYVKILTPGEILHKNFITEFYKDINISREDDILLHSFGPNLSTVQPDPALSLLKTINPKLKVQTKDFILPNTSCCIFKTDLLRDIDLSNIQDENLFKLTAMLNALRNSSSQQGYHFINSAYIGMEDGVRFDVTLQEITKSANGLISLLTSVHSAIHEFSSDAHKLKTAFFLIHNIVTILLRNKKADELLLNNEQEEAKSLLIETINSIGLETIKSYSSSNYNHVHKIGYLKLLGLDAERDICYIEDADEKSRSIKFKIASHTGQFPRCYLDGSEIIPAHVKIKTLSIFNLEFSYEIYFWLSFKKADQKLSIQNKFPTEILVSGKRLKTESYSKLLATVKNKEKIKIELPRKVKLLRSLALSNFSKNKFKSCWLFVDNDLRADDNAEHFYRYVSKQQKSVNAFFLLNKSSPDWHRLKNEGFRLIEFGSLQHRLALLNARYLLSSHANPAIVNYLPRKHYSDIMKYKFVFLQHGVTKDDQSEWLNSRKIDYLVTAGKPEFEDISGDGRYRYTTKETILTGFPRYDNLNKTETRKQILIMPTWRKSLAGELMKKSSKRIKNPDFINSIFCKEWGGFLQSNKLKELAELNNYKILFLPHPNLADYLEELGIPDYIEVGSLENCSIQKVFKESDILLTDYSSVAFDVAYMRKPVIYFQFDSNTFFSEHSYSKGYYDYNEHGFGDVAINSSELLDTLSLAIQNDCELNDFYGNRINDFFPYDDNKNSERLFNHLEGKLLPSNSFDVLYSYLTVQLSQQDLSAAEKTLVEIQRIINSLQHTEKNKLSDAINEMIFWAQIQNRNILLSKLIEHADKMSIVTTSLVDGISGYNADCANINFLPSILYYLNSLVSYQPIQQTITNLPSINDVDNIQFLVPQTALVCKYILSSSAPTFGGEPEDNAELRLSAAFKQSPALLILDSINLIKEGKVIEGLNLLRKIKLSDENKEFILRALITCYSPELRRSLPIKFLHFSQMSDVAYAAYLTLSSHVTISQYESYYSENKQSAAILSDYLDSLYATRSYATFITVFDSSNASDFYIESIENRVRFLLATFINKGIEALNSEIMKISHDGNFLMTFDSMFLNREIVSLDIIYQMIEQTIEKEIYPYTCAEIYKYSLHFYKNSRPGLAKKLATLSVMKMHERFYADDQNWNGAEDYKTMIAAITELNQTILELNKIG